MKFVVSVYLIALSVLLVTSSRVEADEPFQKGDHVCYIGNTLADRMQHDGWLETYLHALLPEHDLTFRNLGFSGDEIKLRQRADNFGDPDTWLTKCQADVVLCFFGYNEALKGQEKLAEFTSDLAETIDGMLTQKYNGKSAPRLIVFSPIAHENLRSPHLPDGYANNQNLLLYTEAMRDVCLEKKVPFVDIFQLSQKLYVSAEKPLTMNGIHLHEHGNRELARAILTAPETPFSGLAKNGLPDDSSIAKLRDAVLDKNYHWFSRYRVIDEYNVFGGRSKLEWFGQSNADVMMREMEIFDVKTANRDRRIWEVARGRDAVLNDDHLPEQLTVKPNKVGPLPKGSFPYLGGEEAIAQMTVQEGLEVNLFASEERFPRLVNPVQMAVDPDGRLWASVWQSYPHWNPAEPRKDAIVILPDEDRDGRADDLIVFADELNSVTGFEFWGGGILIAALPELWFLKDTDGDNRADVKIRMLQGLSSADSHHSANAMLLGPDGWLYWSRGIFNVAAMETPTRTYRSADSGVHRFNPRTFEMEFHFPIGPNPHGDVFDRWGYQFANDGTTGTGGYVSLGKGLRPGNREWFKKEWRPVAATGILSSTHFPEQSQGNFLVCNTIGFLGVLQYQVQYNGAQITANRTTDVLQSNDPNFRPVDIEVGGDGALYIADWHNALIGHMQHNMRDPNRDHTHGRIYRVTAKGRDLLTPPKMQGEPIAEVLQSFFSPENGVRYRTRIELSGRETSDVMREVTAFSAKLDPKNASPQRDEAQALLECLWVHEEHRVPSMSLVAKTFQADDPRVRAAAIRTLGNWAKHQSFGRPMTGHLPSWEVLLASAATDESALVRAEAVKAAVEFEGLAAAEVIFEVATRPTDPELEDVLDYARGLIKVDSMITDSIRSKKKLSPIARSYALTHAAPALLLEMERSTEIFQAILSRVGIPNSILQEAIVEQAKVNRRTSLEELAIVIQTAETQGQANLKDLASLVPVIAKDASGASPTLQKLVEGTRSSEVRSAAFLAWQVASEPQLVWQHAIASRERMHDYLTAISQLQDDRKRAALYPLVRPLMFQLPESLRSETDNIAIQSGPAVGFEYYEPNPGQSVRMEVLDKATPKLTGRIEAFNKYVPGGLQDGFATRQLASIVVPSQGRYTFYLSSDDGSRLYIDDKEVVNNDGLHGVVEKGGSILLGQGLHRITVTYFDNGGGDELTVQWEGPETKKRPIQPSDLRGASGGNLRQQAMELIVAWPGNLKEKVSDFSKLAMSDSLVEPALAALSSLPSNAVAESLGAGEAGKVLKVLLERAGETSPVDRQSDRYAAMLKLGGELTSLSRSQIPNAEEQLKALHASIPTIADPRLMELGAEVYARESHCATCHQANGQGLPNLYPPIDGSLWVTGNQDRLIRLVLDGMHGTIEVKGKRYSSPPLPPMTAFRHLLTDQEIAAVLTYVRNSWSNRAKPVDAKQVAKMRAMDRGKDATFWNVTDLLTAYPMEDGSKPVQQGSADGWVPKFVKEWKFSDFADTDFTNGTRSHQQGMLVFKRMGCVQCHKLGQEGGVFGPNLAELEAKKRTNAVILEAILDPSKEIDEKYAMRTYLTSSGRVVSGFVVKETDESIHVKSDPLNVDESTVVNKDDIEEEKINAKSVMPSGLMNYFSKEEILDLVAYVLAAGDKPLP